MPTYDELIRRVPRWLYAQNRDLVNEMPNVVLQAHEQIVNLLDHDLFRTLIDDVDVGTDGILDLSANDPPVFEIRAIRWKWRNDGDAYMPLMRRDLEMLTQLYANNRPGRPRYYAEYSGLLIQKLFPVPREAIKVQVTANVEPPPLSPTQQTNIISERAFRVMEKATMRQAAIYMRDWPGAAEYEKDMTTAIGEANAQIQRRRRDETEQRPVEAANVSGS